tara:strand:+ start:155 stop:397 length:243 start_codon:yes stop_codon:yes gene_type:complete
MKKLGERNYLLLNQGVGCTGNYVDAYYYAEEELYAKEASIIYNFCIWVEDGRIDEFTNTRSLGVANYEQRFQQFLVQGGK